MKKRVLALMLLMPVAAWGGFYTGNSLMENCDKTESGEAKANVAKYNECGGYLAGVQGVHPTSIKPLSTQARFPSKALPYTRNRG
jgi:hypothetical protein